MSCYHIEVTPPLQKAKSLHQRLERFAKRYCTVIEHGHAVSVTDNAMGRLAFSGNELIRTLKLPTPTDRVMVHLNCFHEYSELRKLLDNCIEDNINQLLIISGDGSWRLPRLQPRDIGHHGEVVTSVELVHHIREKYGNQFKLGGAFNQYEPVEHELDKLDRKIAAGIDFIITQPVIAPNDLLTKVLNEYTIPVILEAWMSPKISLLEDCIGYSIERDASDKFNALQTLRGLQKQHSANDFYLALFDIDNALPDLATY